MFSKDLFQESKKFIPGGVSSPVRAFAPYPFFVKKLAVQKYMMLMEISILTTVWLMVL